MALTALDFPASPTVGQVYPDPPVTGQPQYAWNGTQWLSSKAAVTQIARTDALGWSGMQINGSMEVSQERGGSGTNTSNTYPCDGWYMVNATAGGAISSAQIGSSVAGFSNTLYQSVQTAKAALGASEWVALQQKIEGYRIARLAWGTASAQPLTIGFWSGHHRTGTWSVALRNSAGDRSYACTYTQNVADIMQYNTVTIPGDVSGTWLSTNGVGIEITFTIAADAALITPPNTWIAGGKIAATGQVNGIATTSDVFRLTGVVVLPGIEAPTAAQSPRIMRPYDEELVTCQRYFQRCNTPSGLSHAPAFGYAMSATQAFVLLDYLAEMRATPTLLANIGNWVIQDQINAPHAVSSLSINTASTQSVMFLVGSTGLTTGAPCRLQASPSAGILSLDARL